MTPKEGATHYGGEGLSGWVGVVWGGGGEFVACRGKSFHWHQDLQDFRFDLLVFDPPQLQ